MGGSQSCLNHPNIKVDNVTLNEITDNDVVTTTLVVPKHDKCENGKIITIKRPVDFKTLELGYEYTDEKGGKNVNRYTYQMKEGFGNTSGESGVNINVILSLVIIALVVLYIYKK